ncbi:hypothetical protein FGF82_24705, partial [Salmonella sp. gx-f9]|nr:hypothetical protein [Salmonella sp. gx-f9]
MPDRLLPMMIAAALALSGSFPAAAAAQAPPPEDPGLIAYLRQRALGALDTTRYTAALTPDGRTML